MPSGVINKIAVVENEIWFMYPPDGNGIVNGIARFNGVLQVFDIRDEDNRSVDVSDFLITKDGTLWVNISFPRPGLARFRRDSDSFEIVDDQNKIFRSLDEKADTYNFSDSRLGELSDGQLVVVLDHHIYLYSPENNMAKLILGKEKGVSVKTISTGKEDKIWFMVTDRHNLNLYMYNIQNEKVTNFGTPPNFSKIILSQPEVMEAGRAIAADQQGRVWISYFDRLEPISDETYTWHSMEAPPVFVNTFDPYYLYRWANVFTTHTFSDGNIWFASDIGVVKYDIQNNTWCLTSEVKTFVDYPLTEDKEGNIWTIVGRQIYKLQK